MNKEVNIQIATYAEIRVQTDIMANIANSLLAIKSHICGTELHEVTNELIATNRSLYISAGKTSDRG